VRRFVIGLFAVFFTLLGLEAYGVLGGGREDATRGAPGSAPAAPAPEARLRELVAAGLREPREEASILRGLAESSATRAKAAALGCELLGKKPLELSGAKGTPAEIDQPGREELVDAALLAIASDAQAGAPLACADAVKAELADPCKPQLRCADGAPMTGREPGSHWDEPLCTKAELAAAVTRDLARPAPEIRAAQTGSRRELWAFAALAAAGQIPPALVAAHERRRYAVVQPSGPPCESGLPPGTPCHCDENTLRDFACRNPEASTVHVGLCKYAIDAKDKKLTSVVATPPP
jgi:hypothetical protein